MITGYNSTEKPMEMQALVALNITYRSAIKSSRLKNSGKLIAADSAP
jgi:hypothetical protein